MMKLQMLKQAMIAYVANSAKAIWSAVAHPLSIVGKKNCDVADYRIYGNSVQNGEPTPEVPIEVQSVGELTTKNLLDKDNVTILIESSVTTVKRIETGISLVVKNTKYVNLYAFLDLGLMSDYEGQTIQATMELSRVGNEKYTNNLFVSYDVENNTRTNLGSMKIEGNKLYLNATIGAGYTTERLTIRLYVVAGDEQATGVEYNFNNLMVHTGEEKLDYEPYHKYKVPITVRGKNIFKPYRVSTTSINTAYPLALTNSYGTTINTTDLSDNSVKVTQVPKENYSADNYRNGYICIQTEGLTVGKRYRFSFDIDILENPLNASRFFIYPGGVYPIVYTSFSSTKQRVSCVFTEKLSTQATAYPYIEIRCMGISFTASNFMITEADITDTEYEPYIEPQTVNIYLDEPLRKVGEFADYIDFGKGVVVRNVGNKIFDGTESWGHEVLTRGNNFYTQIADSRGGQYIKVFCNRGRYYQNGNLDLDYSCRISDSLNFNYRYQEFNNLQNFKDKLKEFSDGGNPLYVIYLLEVAKQEPIELPTLPQFKGTTIYEAQTEIPPSGIEVQYF